MGNPVKLEPKKPYSKPTLTLYGTVRELTQHVGARGQAVEQGGAGEDDEAGDEEQLPPEEVGGTAAEQEKPAKDKRVRIDDPLQARGGEMEVALDRRQRHVHDRRVQDDHELGDANDHQDEPAVGLGSVGHLTAVGFNDGLLVRIRAL